MHSFDLHHLNDDHCFLCGEPLTDSTRSDEHVIPKWLQHDHDLWNQKLVLLNHSEIPYRKVTIPCCRTCNNEHLSNLEASVSRLLKGKYRDISLAEEVMLFQWCSKLLYGLLHKELAIVTDWIDPKRPKILQRAFLENLTTFHHFMTSIKRRFAFAGFKPYSLFVFETCVFDDPGRNFDYFDFVTIGAKNSPRLALTLAARVNHFGIICVFQDNGYQKRYFQNEFDQFRGIPVHPIQFIELAAKTACKHATLAFSPSYTSFAEEGYNSTITVVQASFPDQYIWGDWDFDAYAHVFTKIAKRSRFGVPDAENIYVGGDKHWSWLKNEDGSVKVIEPQDEHQIQQNG